MRDDKRTECPDRDRLAAFAADPAREENAALAAHICVCDRCAEALRTILTSVAMTDGERAFITRFTAEKCRPPQAVEERFRAFAASRRLALVTAEPDGFALAAATADAGTASAKRVKAPDEEVRFVFVSEGEPDSSDAWRAELSIPPGATAETLLSLKVFDARGFSAAGRFRLAGAVWPLEDGTAQIPFGLFLSGIGTPEATLVRADGKAFPGRLVFF